MNGEAVNAVASLAVDAAGKLVTIEGVQYSTTALIDVRKAEPVCEPVKIHTLTGLLEFVKLLIGAEREESDSFALHVVNHHEVRLVDAAIEGRFRQRELYASATFEELIGMAGGFQFGTFVDAEKFNVALQSLFIDSHDRARVLSVVGNLADEKVLNASDDGISQTVTGRAGVVTKAAVVAPNPVTLAPFRTFREIAQPESQFILRLQAGREGGLPNAALFEADGGAWRLKAIEFIAAYLRAKTAVRVLA